MKTAILGYGNIGSGVAQVLRMNADCVARRAGEPLEVKYVLDLREFPGDPMEKYVVHDLDIIVKDPEVKIVVETMGGTKPAYDFVKACLKAGKHVATSNKELVAKHGAELMQIAEEKHINFLFEASVGGGIPIIRPLNECITADEIDEITGILNGTTNFMLTEMAQEGMPYEEVLKQAQELGYAERNPEADVEGHDACRKISILASLVYGRQVDSEEVYTEGITELSDRDMAYAAAMGRTVKLLGTARKKNGEVYVMVSPVMIGQDHPLYSVNGVLNGILVNGGVIGDLMFYGAGAGKLPTASAVVADMVDAARNQQVTVMQRWSAEKLELGDWKKTEKQFFVRLSGNPENRLAEAEKAFGPCQVQKISGMEEFGVVTPVLSEADFEEAAARLEGVISRIRLA
ncbi:homoserine dehydrogenase [Cuneatibacter caecimuris]|uniref:Homoserine dehydrogenase n=1 Tax=Cuneatibacter caecimuris TaxID=1796618 RepID=A0A4Q7PJU0_9FIRM|nr:homoserine dehydrogenase [Cuneatibacter caecimuris]RZT00736.1 homoserine dehydrogenase [Cuneatibacter caecimuris]